MKRRQYNKPESIPTTEEWIMARKLQIEKAISRHSRARLPYPVEWTRELLLINEELEKYDKQN